MKTRILQTVLPVAIGAGLLFSTLTTRAQEASAASPAQPAVASTAAPQLPYGVSQILQLKQAEVGDDTIIAYIKNSGTSYGLNADQIIYLQKQGLSSAVITAMLNQPKPGVAAAAPAAPAPQTSTSTVNAEPASTVTYVQTVPTYDYYQPYYYPAYGFYPGVSLSFGWGGRWGGGYGGGWHGGWHGGGHR